MILGSCTEYKNILPLHELLFCVGQDSPLKLPYGHIVCKGTSPLHGLLFCVGKVAPLNLPYGHILQGYLTPCSFVLGKLPFEVALCSHCLQRKFTPSWTTSMCWLRLLLDLTLWILTLCFYVLHLDVVLISLLWIFVSHKCCNNASKIYPLCFDKYSCFLTNFSYSCCWEIPVKY